MSLITAVPAVDVCKTSIKTMADFAGRNSPEVLNPHQYGTLMALNAGVNQIGAMEIPTTQFTDLTDDADATMNRLSVKFRLRRCNDDTGASLDPCVDDGATHQPWAYRDFHMTTPLTASFTVKYATMRRMCSGDYSEEYANLFREAATSLLRQANARMITQLQANLGNYHHTDCDLAVSSAAYRAPVGLFDTNGNPKPMGAFRVLQQYTLQGFQGAPLTIGGSIIDAIRMAAGFYQNNVNGFDMSKLQGLQFYTDYQTDAVLNNGSVSNILTVAPGSARPITWNRFEGQNEYASSTLVKKTIELGDLMGIGIPMKVDYTIYAKECGQTDVEYIHKLYWYIDLFALQSYMLAPGCGQCSNGILIWDHDCEDGSCTDLNPIITEPEAPE